MDSSYVLIAFRVIPLRPFSIRILDGYHTMIKPIATCAASTTATLAAAPRKRRQNHLNDLFTSARAAFMVMFRLPRAALNAFDRSEIIAAELTFIGIYIRYQGA